MPKIEFKKKTEEELKKITDEVVERILDNDYLTINKIILYGSYARGDADGESDIDIMVLCENNEDDLDKIRYAANVISSRISIDNDIDVSMTLKDKSVFDKWLDAVPFYQNVVKEGIVLYG